MRIKNSKIIFFSIFLMFFGMGQNIDALNYSNGLQINEDTNQLLAKEGGGTKKSGNKKSASKKSSKKKSNNKKNIINEKNPVLVKVKIVKMLWKKQQKKDMRHGKKIKRKIKNKSDKTIQNNFERFFT